MKGFIYTIKTGNSLYVGSTKNFTQRKYQHKKNIEKVNNKSQKKLYDTIRQNGEWDMRIYKECDYNICYELKIKENEVIKELGADLNTTLLYSATPPKNPTPFQSKEMDRIYREMWETRNSRGKL
jgi:predicted GIY-YIG superfamily endonuclease